MNYIMWDLESVANDKAKDYYAKKTYKAPANWKDPVKIEEYVVTARHEDMQKAALTWWTGKIVCISIASLRGAWKPKTFVGFDEKELVTLMFEHLLLEKDRPVLIGKEADVFDTPFLRGRCLALNTGIPDFLRPYRPIEDINHIFGFSARCNQIGKLADYAFGLGIEGKHGHGTDVQTWFDQAELGDENGLKKIASYCGMDVEIVRVMMERWTKPYVSRDTRAKGPETRLQSKPAPEPELEIPFGSNPEPLTVSASQEDLFYMEF